MAQAAGSNLEAYHAQQLQDTINIFKNTLNINTNSTDQSVFELTTADELQAFNYLLYYDQLASKGTVFVDSRALGEISNENQLNKQFREKGWTLHVKYTSPRESRQRTQPSGLTTPEKQR